MPRRNWKQHCPPTLRDAIKESKEYALNRRNMSVERIAAQSGITDHWSLYKYVQNGRMPASVIVPFEQACGINLITRWLAATGGKLLIDIPTGRSASSDDMQALQEQLTSVTGTLLKFYGGNCEADEALADIQAAMEVLAWHRGNILQHAHPQLEL